MGLLKETVHSRNSKTNSVLSHPTKLGLHPRSRILGLGPGLIDRTPEQKLEQVSLAVCAHFHFRRSGRERAAEETGSHSQRPVFILLDYSTVPKWHRKNCVYSSNMAAGSFGIYGGESLASEACLVFSG